MRKQLNELTICNAALHSGQNSLTEDRDFLKKHYEELENDTREQRAVLAMAKEAVGRVYNSRFERGLQARRAEFNARLTIYCQRIKEMYRVKLYEADEAPEEVDDGLDESAQLRPHLQEVKDRVERQNPVVDELRKTVAELEERLAMLRLWLRESKRQHKLVIPSAVDALYSLNYNLPYTKPNVYYMLLQ